MGGSKPAPTNRARDCLLLLVCVVVCWRSGVAGRVRAGRWSGAGRQLIELERAVAAEDSAAGIARARAFGVIKLGIYFVTVIVALHGECTVRVVVCDRAFGLELCGAVVANLAVDHQIAGASLFAVLAVKDAVLYFTRENPLVGRGFAVRDAGEVRGVSAVVAATGNRS